MRRSRLFRCRAGCSSWHSFFLSAVDLQTPLHLLPDACDRLHPQHAGLWRRVYFRNTAYTGISMLVSPGSKLYNDWQAHAVILQRRKPRCAGIARPPLCSCAATLHRRRAPAHGAPHSAVTSTLPLSARAKQVCAPFRMSRRRMDVGSSKRYRSVGCTLYSLASVLRLAKQQVTRASQGHC